MASIFEIVENAISPLGIPYACGDFIVASGTDWPDTYIDYIVVDLDPAEHADDEEIERANLVQVSIHKRITLMALPDVMGQMTGAGFTFAGGRQIEKDEETGHLQIAYDFEYLENV